MINRIGLTIHWLGFIGAIFYLGSTIYLGVIVKAPFNYLFVPVLLSASYLLISWLTKFVITGNKNLFPWVKEKNS